MMNQRPPMQGIANQMAQHGRYGDSMLVHMNPIEVQGIASLSPTGSLTTNPVTGQPEAFLPFLAPLLGSFLGSSFLTGAGAGALGGLIGSAGLSSGLAGAIGSGLATTAVTGDLKKGLISGLTGYGVGQALGAAGDVASGADITQGALDTTGELASEAASDYASQAANLEAMSVAAGQPGSMIDPVADIAQAGSQTADALARSNALAGQQSALQSQVATQRAGQTAMERMSAPFQNPGTFGKALIKPTNLAAIGVGEGQRGQIEMEERFARDAKRFSDEKERELERARAGLTQAYGQLESDYPGYKIPGYQAGGITAVNPSNYMANLRGVQMLAGGGRTIQNFYEGGRFGTNEYNSYMGASPNFGVGSAASRQSNIRGSQVISPAQLQGYRPGFSPEINYFQRPEATPPGTTPPGTTPPGTTPPGTTPPGTNPPGRGPGRGTAPAPTGPITAGGLGDFDYTDYLSSEEGQAAMSQVRSALGIPDFSTIDERLASIEGRPDPTIPAIDYDEITNRVRGGIDMPTIDLSGIEDRLGAIETRPTYTPEAIDYDMITNRVREGIDIPDFKAPDIDYDMITRRVREGIDIPSYDNSAVMDAIAANRDAISGMPSSPAFDYDEIANRVRGSIDIPEYDFSGIESRLGAIEGRPDPTFDISGIMSAIDSNRQAISGIPSIDLSGIESRLGTIEGREMPTVDLSGIESRLGSIEGREMPTFDTSGLMSAIDANRQAIAGIPAIDFSGIESRLSSIEGRPDPTFDTSGLMSAIDANRQAIAGLPAPAPAFDSSGIMGAIDANRQAIAGLPGPSPAFDPSSILSAIEANRAAIGGINSGGINPDPTQGLPTRSVPSSTPVKSGTKKADDPIKLPPRRVKGKGFAEGGEVDLPADQGSRIIDLTIAAVMGQLPEDQAEAVINRFVDEFGSEAFSILRKQVLQGGIPGAQTEGKINGNGGGMDDKVPGMIGDQQPVAVSPGEFIVPADVVSGLGDGSTDAGVQELHGMMDKVRSERTGMRQQPNPINKSKVMPV